MSNVRIFKLMSGEEVIGELVQSELMISTKVQVKNPAKILVSQQGVGMIPFCMLSKDQVVDINQDHVTCITTPEDEVANGYNSKFGSGIVIATGGSQLQIDGF